MIINFENFPASWNVQGNQNISLEVEDIIKSSVAIVNAYGIPKVVDEIKWRQHMILAYLEELDAGNGNVEIIRKVGFKHLDPSEKGGISFHLGMAATAAVAKKKLGFKSIVHFDSLMNFWRDNNISSGVRLRSGNARPDLVGFRIPRRHAQRANYGIQRGYFECKGRSNGFDQAAMDSARSQLQNIYDPNLTTLKVASQFYFQGSMDSFRGNMVDPPEGDLLSGISDQEFVSSIVFIEALSAVKIVEEGKGGEWSEILKDGHRTGFFDGADYSIEINKSLYDSVKKISEGSLRSPDFINEFGNIKELVEYSNFDNLLSYNFKKKNRFLKDIHSYTVEKNSDLISFLRNEGYESYEQSWLKFLEDLFIDYKDETLTGDTELYQQPAKEDYWTLKVLGRRVGLVKFMQGNSFEINLGFNEKKESLNRELVRFFKSSCSFRDDVDSRVKERGREPIVLKFSSSDSFFDSQNEIRKIIHEITQRIFQR